MSPAQIASERLLTQIPRERIRTHEARLEPITRVGRPVGDVPASRRATIARLGNEINQATGKRWTVRQMAELLGISTVAVFKHRRVLRGDSYRRKGKR